MKSESHERCDRLSIRWKVFGGPGTHERGPSRRMGRKREWMVRRRKRMMGSFVPILYIRESIGAISDGRASRSSGIEGGSTSGSFARAVGVNCCSFESESSAPTTGKKGIPFDSLCFVMLSAYLVPHYHCRDIE